MESEIQRALRAKMARTQKKQFVLAAEIGVTPSVFSRWLSQKRPVRPDIRNCGAIAVALDIPLLDVLQMAGYAPEDAASTPPGAGQIDTEWDHFQYGLREVFALVPRSQWWPVLAAVAQFVTAFQASPPTPGTDYSSFNASIFLAGT